MDVMAHVISVEHGEAAVELPAEVLQRMGLRVGDPVRVTVRELDGGSELVIEPISAPTARTIVADRYHGVYSGGGYIAWPLPEAAIPPASQGGDSEAADFWFGEIHLCGKGSSPEEALADLERCLLDDQTRRIGVAKDKFAVPESIDTSNDELRDLFEGPEPPPTD